MTFSKNSTHSKIIEVLRKETNKYPNFTDRDWCLFLFRNFRLKGGEPAGLLLTSFGDKLMSYAFANYTYELDEVVTNKILLNLDRHMSWPYYLYKNRKKIRFYNESDAAWFKLSGSLQYFSESNGV